MRRSGIVHHHIGLVAALVLAGCVRRGPADVMPSRGSERSPDPGQEVVAHGPFRVDRLELGTRPAGDTLWFRARVTNVSDASASFGLDLRAVAGQWSPSGSERTFAFHLPAHEQRTIEASLALRRLTVESALRVSFGVPVPQPDAAPRIEQLFFRNWYPLGTGNPRAADLGAGMVQLTTGRLLLYAVPGAAAARDLPSIAAQRDSAVRAIEEVLGARFEGHIRMVFYPDSATKTRATGHIGMGLAFDRNIVEIYADTARLDPYHELTHIVAGTIGNPPALLNEGLATYMTERLGGDALEYLGNRGRRIDSVVCGYRREERLIPLDSLLHFDDIGSDETQPVVSYPESASIVKFLVEHRGLPRFREVYRNLMNSTDPARWRSNAAVLERTYGVSIATLERDWLAALGCR